MVQSSPSDPVLPEHPSLRSVAGYVKATDEAVVVLLAVTVAVPQEGDPVCVTPPVVVYRAASLLEAAVGTTEAPPTVDDICKVPNDRSVPDVTVQEALGRVIVTVASMVTL